MFYLDAHWNADLPLVEEIGIIASNWSEFIAMIDDFQVPHDEGYGYDDYGDHQRFTLNDFGSTFERYALIPFFPTAPSDRETGHRRGCVVLVGRGELSDALGELSVLTRHAR